MKRIEKKEIWESVYDSITMNNTAICNEVYERCYLNEQFSFGGLQELLSDVALFKPQDARRGQIWWDCTMEGQSSRLTAVAFLIAMNS